jgi:hypothetical protein
LILINQVCDHRIQSVYHIRPSFYAHHSERSSWQWYPCLLTDSCSPRSALKMAEIHNPGSWTLPFWKSSCVETNQESEYNVSNVPTVGTLSQLANLKRSCMPATSETQSPVAPTSACKAIRAELGSKATYLF